ncbi:hypothetical protein PoB_000287000 [Plakobranchus ocellatus]|uniref:Uncharacterized protein n=1 Tax=Plakobranchus ocellatus TaxID=259542 RepID=A0AAV3Y0E1_9GAST|nr:hypothetical protein PoB_000287000 [Plakobranchus ocellatus]
MFNSDLGLFVHNLSVEHHPGVWTIINSRGYPNQFFIHRSEHHRRATGDPVGRTLALKYPRIILLQIPACRLRLVQSQSKNLRSPKLVQSLRRKMDKLYERHVIKTTHVV